MHEHAHKKSLNACPSYLHVIHIYWGGVRENGPSMDKVLIINFNKKILFLKSSCRAKIRHINMQACSGSAGILGKCRHPREVQASSGSAGILGKCRSSFLKSMPWGCFWATYRVKVLHENVWGRFEIFKNDNIIMDYIWANSKGGDRIGIKFYMMHGKWGNRAFLCCVDSSIALWKKIMGQISDLSQKNFRELYSSAATN